ncbi:hypothetical protein B0H16DRAFT_1632047, partial [Mycena metata]
HHTSRSSVSPTSYSFTSLLPLPYLSARQDPYETRTCSSRRGRLELGSVNEREVKVRSVHKRPKHLKISLRLQINVLHPAWPRPAPRPACRAHIIYGGEDVGRPCEHPGRNGGQHALRGVAVERSRDTCALSFQSKISLGRWRVYPESSQMHAWQA